MLKNQTHPPTYLSTTDQKIPKINESAFTVEIQFSVDFTFIKFPMGVSARHTSQFLVWNVFLSLKRCTFWKEASGINLILTLKNGPRTLAIYFFSLLGAVYI